MIVRFAAFVALIASVVVACASTQSQPPTPGRGEGDRKTQSESAQAQNAPAVNERGTADNPLTVSIAPSEADKRDAAYKEEDRRTQASERNWSKTLAVLTFLATLGQIGLLLGQVRIASKQNKIIQGQSDIMDKQRIAADAQVQHMADSLAEAKRSADAAVEQTKVAERHMYLSLRARVAMKHINVFNLGPERQSSISFTFQNFGGKTALIETYSARVTWNPIPNQPDYAPEQRLDFPLEAGQPYELSFEIDPPIPQDVWGDITSANPRRRLTFYGFVRYKVGFGKITEQVGFCRHYDRNLSEIRSQPCLSIPDTPGYNYARECKTEEAT